MGEEAADPSDFSLLLRCADDGADGERVVEWETGLPDADDLTPLSQPLVPPDLAAAFRIPPEPGRTILDVHRASQSTVASLRRSPSSAAEAPSILPFTAPPPAPAPEEDPSAAAAAGELTPGAAAAQKRPRLVWTPQLHKRFVDVVGHLGIKNAVPKTIMQLMNVEGLTRENVASHLQKYRLYVKRMQGSPTGGDAAGPSPSDHLFASTPVPPSLHEPPQAPALSMPVPVHPFTAMYFNGGAASASGHPMGVGLVPVSGGHFGAFGHHPAMSYPHFSSADNSEMK